MKRVFGIILALVLVLALSVTVFACSDKSDAVKEVSRVLEFGTYPQSEVTDSATKTALAAAAGILPTESDSAEWTSYKYYIEGSNDTDFMWYIDLEYAGEKYRGVYFASYRPNTTGGSYTMDSYQDDNGYTTGNVYWFKYEPIKWRILAESDGEALILCEMVIDSQEYYKTATGSTREIDGETVYENNYAYSNIRAWLNGTFYNTAFSDSQRQNILLTTVDNSARSTNPNNNATAFDYGINTCACADTEDYIFLLSMQEATNADYGFNSSYSNEDDPARQKKNTDYAKSQGVYIETNSSYAGNGYWWLRSPSCGDSGCNVVRGVNYQGYAAAGSDVCGTSFGVVPALRIKLS